MKIYRIISIIFVFILTNNLYAQFIDVQTKIDLRQIREKDHFYFDNIVENINNFFTENIFGTDIDDLGIQINLHLIFESISESDNQKIINGQIIVTNRSDIFSTLRGFSFSTRDLNRISYDINSFSSLSSLLEFSAYLLIANELDTYESKGGNEYYNIALSLAHKGKESDFPRGWNDRLKKCKTIKENTFLRDMKYYFFLAYENIQDNNLENLEENIIQMHEQIKLNNDFIGIDTNTLNFFKAYHKDIINYYKKISFIEGLAYLKLYDIDNKPIYQEAIEFLNQ